MCVARGDFFKIGNLAPFSKFLHIKGQNFADDFIRSRLPMTPMNHEKFHGNRSARFLEIGKTDRHTHTQMRQLYISRGPSLSHEWIDPSSVEHSSGCLFIRGPIYKKY